VLVPHLVLDTNLVGFEHPLGSNDARVLLDAARHGQLVLVVPELVVREVMNKWRETMTSRLSKLDSTVKNLGEFAADIDVPSNSDLDHWEGEVEERFRNSLNGENFLIPGLPDVAHDSIVSRALQRLRPFDPEGKDGYRDVLLWETVLDLAAEQDVVLVSKDFKAFAADDKETLAESLVEEAAERLQRADAVELCTSLELAVERFTSEDAVVTGRAAKLVRVDSFRRILEDAVDDAIESYYLSPPEIATLGLDAEVPFAHVVGLTRSLGRISVDRAFEIEEGVGLVDLSIFTAVELGFYASFKQAHRLRDRNDVWLPQGEWDELRSMAGEEVHLMTSRNVELKAECAVRLAPGTIERLALVGMRAIDANEFREPEAPIDEEPGDVWPADDG
jgi:hypothetical protein